MNKKEVFGSFVELMLTVPLILIMILLIWPVAAINEIYLRLKGKNDR